MEMWNHCSQPECLGTTPEGQDKSLTWSYP